MFYSDKWAYFRFQRTGSKIIAWILIELENGVEKKEELFTTVREPEALRHKGKVWISSVRHPLPWNHSHYDDYIFGLQNHVSRIYNYLEPVFYTPTDHRNFVNFGQHLDLLYSCDLDEEWVTGHGHHINPYIMNSLGIGVQTYKFLDMYSKYHPRHFLDLGYTIDDLLEDYDNYMAIDDFIIHSDVELFENTMSTLTRCGINYSNEAVQRAKKMVRDNPKRVISYKKLYTPQTEKLVLEKEQFIIKKFFKNGSRIRTQNY